MFDHMSMQWAPNLLEEHVGVNLTIYQVQETDDSTVSDSLNVVVQALRTYNVNITLEVGASFELEYRPLIHAPDCVMEVSCWSVECTSQLAYKGGKWKMAADGWNAISNKNTTFVYLLDYKCP